LSCVSNSQHSGPANQSEHIVLFRKKGFMETGTKQGCVTPLANYIHNCSNLLAMSVKGRLGREVLQQCQMWWWEIMCFLNSQALKPTLLEPKTPIF